MDSQALHRLPLFASLSDGDLSKLAELLETRQVPANKVIFFIGDKGDELFLVQEGSVRLTAVDEHGKELTLGAVGAGAFFGELSLLDGGLRTATAVVQKDAVLLVLKRADFFAFMERHTGVASVMVQTMAGRLRDNLEKLKGVKNVNDEVDADVTPLQHAVDRAARLFSSGRFLLLNLSLFAAWIIVQTYEAVHHGDRISFIDDPPYFFWLGFIITSEAFLLTVFVLNSQRRQADRDRIQADLEYQVNLKAQHEIMQLHAKIDQLQETIVKRLDDR
jgi:uncharacterized membrane protein